MNRRKTLATVTAIMTASIAGCSTDCEHEPDTLTAEEVLPDPASFTAENYTTDSSTSLGMSGADDSYEATWVDPDDEDYSIETIRYCDEQSAEDDIHVDGSDTFLAHDIFAFGINGPDEEHREEALIASQLLNRQIVRSEAVHNRDTEDEDETDEENEIGGLELRNVDAEVRNGTLAHPVVFGELKNHTDEELELVEVIVRLFDDRDNRFERKAVRTNGLRAEGVWSWEAEFFGTDPERIGSYDVEADIMIR